MVNKVQGWILALGTAGIAASGALFGAQMKAEKEALPVPQAETRKDESTTKAKPAEKQRDQSMTTQHIASLEAQRSQLMSQRFTIEKKLAALHEKMALNAEKEKKRAFGQNIMDKK